MRYYAIAWMRAALIIRDIDISNLLQSTRSITSITLLCSTVAVYHNSLLQFHPEVLDIMNFHSPPPPPSPSPHWFLVACMMPPIWRRWLRVNDVRSRSVKSSGIPSMLVKPMTRTHF